jgi:tetratricopeptide (TPR) repeat protein
MGLHSLLTLILNGLEDKATKEYQLIKTPTALDDRWGGYALLLTQPLKGKELLVRAIARGCDVARIELAAAYRTLGDWQRAYAEIESLILIFPTISVMDTIETKIDRALLMRELAIHQQTLGDDVGALTTLELAWASAISHLELRPLHSGIAQAMARIYIDQRRYAQAEHYLTVALNDTTIPERAARVLLNRARSRLFQADFVGAKDDLESVRQRLMFVSRLAASMEYVAGMVHRALQQWHEAIAAFERASVTARQTENLEVAFHAELCLATCHVTLEQFNEAELHLSRAKKLKNLSERDMAFLEWRSGQVFTVKQPNLALKHLTQAKTAFDKLHMPREFMGVCLHLANLHIHNNKPQAALSALYVATHTAFESEDQAAWIELSGLPLVQQFLALNAPAAWYKTLMPAIRVSKEAIKQNIQLNTLGRAELKVDGQVIHFEMTRTIEIIAFLLKNPNVGIEKILTALFADTDPRKAGNYFHKVRQILKSLTNTVWVAYDASKKTYLVESSADLYWDAQAVQHILSTNDDNGIIGAINAYTGEFLPFASSQWAIEERETLAWNIIKVGLETLQGWYEIGEHAKCLTLAHRLLEIEPFNPAIHEFVINTTLSLEGELAAKRELLRASRRFTDQFGEVPREFDRLRHALLN